MSNQEADELREVERKARDYETQVERDMEKHPRARWILNPLRSLFRWIGRGADDELRDEGWR